jgi:hypothetical protein
VAVQQWDPEPTGVFVSGLRAAVFASMLRESLMRRIAPSTGIDPRNAAELREMYAELDRVGRVWMRSRRPISVAAVAAVPATEMAPDSVADMEKIDTKKAGELLRLTDSRGANCCARRRCLAGRLVGVGWSRSLTYSRIGHLGRRRRD